MNSRWFRLYDSVVDDPKVQRLPDGAFRHWVNLLCVASRNGGAIPADSGDIAFALRVSEEEARAILRALEEARLMERQGDFFRPHNWDRRQFRSDVSTERTRRFRERREGVPENGSESDSESETDTDSKADSRRVRAGETDTRNKRTRKEQDELFREFYAAYPRHVGRAAAFKAYQAALAKAAPEALLRGARRYAEERMGQAPRFTAHPASWLNAERWRDGESNDISMPVPGEAELAGRWNGAAAKLVARIGAKNFLSLFDGAEFSAGPPVTITVPFSVQADRIRAGAGPQLEEIYGMDVQVAVRKG